MAIPKRIFYPVLALLFVFLACSPWPTPDATVEISVYFLDTAAFSSGTPPFAVTITRSTSSTSNLPEAVLDEFFAGPTAAEQSQGLDVILSGATGYSALDIQNGIARVYLTGTCNNQGAAYNIASLLVANLEQFDEVRFVKIYDENGHTQQPDGDSHSIPACLEP